MEESYSCAVYNKPLCADEILIIPSDCLRISLEGSFPSKGLNFKSRILLEGLVLSVRFLVERTGIPRLVEVVGGGTSS